MVNILPICDDKGNLLYANALELPRELTIRSNGDNTFSLEGDPELVEQTLARYRTDTVRGTIVALDKEIG